MEREWEFVREEDRNGCEGEEKRVGGLYKGNGRGCGPPFCSVGLKNSQMRRQKKGMIVIRNGGFMVFLFSI